MTRDRFEELVREAVGELPERHRRCLANVVFVVEDEPSPQDVRAAGLDSRRDSLFGLFEGTPLSERTSAMADEPARIVLFYRPLVRAMRTPWAIRREIRNTVIHEVAHFFGLDEEEVAREGYA